MQRHKRLGAAALALCVLCCLPVRADDGRKQELTDRQQETQQAYEDAQSDLEALESAQQQTESEIGQLEGQTADLAKQLDAVYAALQEADRQLLEKQAAADAEARALEEA